MWKPLGIIGIIGIVLVIFSQFMRMHRENEPVVPSHTIEAVLAPPPQVVTILNRSCIDCHTEKTNWRWYSNISPILWLMAADVNTGREHMNFSVWGRYSTDEQIDRLSAVCGIVQSRKMPLWYYRMVHPGVGLSDSEVGLLCNWANSEVGRLKGAGP